jgi:ATP-binding cassette subfamily C protein LapB
MSRETSFNYFNCIEPLLEALNWNGNERHLHESAPYFQNKLDITDMRNMLVNLGYKSTVHDVSLHKAVFLDKPFLFLNDTDVYIVYEIDQNKAVVYNILSKKKEEILKNHNPKGKAISFSINKPNDDEKMHRSWFRSVLLRFAPHFKKIALMTFISTLFTLTIPIFISSVYTWVIPAESYSTLNYLLIGMIMALIIEQIIHYIKSKSMAYIGARINIFIGIEVVRQILFLPTSFVEQVSMGGQIARIKQMEAIREIFTGPLAHLILEIPFVLVFLLVLWYMGGMIVLIPISLMIIFLIAAIFMLPYIRDSNQQITESNRVKQNFLVETIMNILTIKQLALERVWQEKYHGIYKKLAVNQIFSQTVSSHNQTISQMIMKIAGIMTIFVSAYKVMLDEMMAGYLITIVILVWRALGPIQLSFMVLSQYDMIKTSIANLNRLTAMETEEKPLNVHIFKPDGYLSVQGLSFRYPGESKMTLGNISFDIEPGEILAILGHNSSVKSTLVKLLLGFYKPTVGNVYIDGLDVMHLDPIRLRQEIAYVPQDSQFFYGTIEQNLLLGSPELKQNKLEEALELAGIKDDIKRLPNGIKTRISDSAMKEFSSGFLQKLNIARAFCRDSKLIIMDEPGNNLDIKSDMILQESTKLLAKDRSIILISHRPSMFNLANKVLVLENGVSKAFGEREMVFQFLNNMNPKNGGVV